MAKQKIQERLKFWEETALQNMSVGTKKRYMYAMEKFLTEYPTARKVLYNESISKEDYAILGNCVSDWVFVKHKKPLLISAYALFLFMKFYFGATAVDRLKDLMNFKHKQQPPSHRIVRDYNKINGIIKKLHEPYDSMARLEWETGCRSGALFKMKFNIDLNDPKNMFVIKAIKEGKFSKDILDSNQDSFWLRQDGYYMIQLQEKRGKVLERVITKDLYDWLQSWKDVRLGEIKELLDQHYNLSKKFKFKRKMNNKLFPVTVQYYNKTLQRIAFTVGIQNFSSHWFRGSRATYLMEKGMNIRKIQTLLGHSNISTTERYTPIDVSTKDQLDEYLNILKGSV